MKRVFILVQLTIVLTLYPQNFYPEERTLSVSSSISSSFFGEYGGVEASLNFNRMDQHFMFGIFTGYDFIYPYAGLNLGYEINIRDIVSFTPELGFYINDTLRLRVNGVLDFHIFNRNYISINSGIDGRGDLFIMFGIKKQTPYFLPVPLVNFTFNLSPSKFSPDGDKENDTLFIDLDIKNPSSIKKIDFNVYDSKSVLFYTYKYDGKLVNKIEWDGFNSVGESIQSAENYLIEIVTTDLLNRETKQTKELLSDILVETVNGQRKIKIASIVFPADSADFLKLDNQQIERNQVVILKLYEKLSKYPDYAIEIVGYGNLTRLESEKSMEKENRDILIPLTTKRAQKIKDSLVELGMDSSKISVLGLGGINPIYPYTDIENNWKNRRVEFILVK
ncbi:MAG: OmpA family protein [Spirochaetales bacterium]|nr:OmpA family protein [Spirochaetales bacterium]